MNCALVLAVIFSGPLVSGTGPAARPAPHGPEGTALEQAFARPPASARPHTWWHWMNGMVTAEGITADLEAMNDAGLGGAQIFNVDQHTPPGPAPFMSPPWRALVRHAVDEAHRLGLELCIHNCAGWSSSGGPWVDPQFAMQRLVTTETQVTGPVRFDGTLPRPEARLSFYRDIAVLAFPTPGGAPELDTLRIEDLEGKIAVRRRDDLKPAPPAPAGQTGASAKVVDRETVVDLTGRLDPGGTLRWEVPAGSWTILRIGHTPTGATNAPAPPEGRGPEVDKLSRAAMDRFFAGMMKTVLDDNEARVGTTLVNALVDSYEVGSQNWTPGLRAAFRKRCGYHLVPWLVTASGRVVDSVERSERFLWDFRRTIAALFRDNYFSYFAELCHQRGMLASVEPYGNGLFDDLEAGAAFDIPMGEFWVDGGAIGTLKIASSIAHTTGKTIVGAESFTARPESGRWQLDPWALKAIGDRAFTMGINRLILHCDAMQPWLDRAPGMTMGPWGTCFGRNNTWWPLAGAWTTYLARCQLLLQQGRFVGDVLYYVGEDSPTSLRAGVPPLPSGYDYDGSSRSRLLEDLAVDGDGRLVLPCGMTYRVLVLPDTDTMTVIVARRIRSLVEAGATIVGPRPRRSPSLAEIGEGDETVRRIAEVLWGEIDGKTVRRHSFGKGRVYSGLGLDTILEELGVPPDFTCSGVPEGEILHIHRRIPVRERSGDERAPAAAAGDVGKRSGAMEIYFVSNQADVTRSVNASFRVAGLEPEFWHPDTGLIEPAALYWHEDPAATADEGTGRETTAHATAGGDRPVRVAGRTVVPLLLDPRGSLFVVFRKPAGATHHLTGLACDGRSALTLEQPAGQPRMEIKQAIYGILDDPAKCRDVTAEVAARRRRGASSVRASNDLAGDPAVNVVKQMRVDFTLDGEARSVTVREGQSVTFPDMQQVLRPAAWPMVQPDGSIAVVAWKGGRYEFRGDRTDALPVVVDIPDPGPPRAIDGPWEVRFPAELGAPARVVLDRLESWTENADPGVRYFSGTATYRKTFDLPDGFIRPGDRVRLDLGRVKNLATVRLNGSAPRTLWKAPFEVDVTDLVEDGENRLIIEVTNLWPNRLIGDELEPDDGVWDGDHLARWPDWLFEGRPRPASGRVAFTVWKHWRKDDLLLESGLIGPVLLRRARQRI